MYKVNYDIGHSLQEQLTLFFVAVQPLDPTIFSSTLPKVGGTNYAHSKLVPRPLFSSHALSRTSAVYPAYAVAKIIL